MFCDSHDLWAPRFCHQELDVSWGTFEAKSWFLDIVVFVFLRVFSLGVHGRDGQQDYRHRYKSWRGGYDEEDCVKSIEYKRENKLINRKGLRTEPETGIQSPDIDSVSDWVRWEVIHRLWIQQQIWRDKMFDSVQPLHLQSCKIPSSRFGLITLWHVHNVQLELRPDMLCQLCRFYRYLDIHCLLPQFLLCHQSHIGTDRDRWPHQIPLRVLKKSLYIV